MPVGGELAGGKEKVKGAALGAFAGFLEREWRVNGIRWGRLDGRGAGSSPRCFLEMDIKRCGRR